MAWNHVALSGSPKRAWERLFVKVKAKTPRCWRYQDPGITTKDSSKRHGAGLRLTDKLCVLQTAETEKWSCPRPFEPRKR